MLTGYHPKSADVGTVVPSPKDLPNPEDPHSLENLLLDDGVADDAEIKSVEDDTEPESKVVYPRAVTCTDGELRGACNKMLKIVCYP